MKRSFVSFINNQCWITFQIRFHHKLSQKHTVSHIFDDCAFTCVILKSNRISDLFSDFASHLLTDSCCYTHSCDPSWLGASDLSPFSISNLMQILRQLSSFSRACLSNHNNNLIVFNQSQKFTPIFIYW